VTVDWREVAGTALARLEADAARATLQPLVDDLGRVVRLGDGVAFVEGLDGAMVDEVVRFPGGATGQVFDLDRDIVACVLHESDESIRAGTVVTRTGRTPTMPVGDALLGRVVGALGHPRDGLGPLGTTEERPVEQGAPGPLDRQPVRQPLLTGIVAVDAAIPIGLGQRELILGDRETGKTSIALDAIINQRDSGVACVYVSIGRKRASVVEVVDELRRHGALAHTAVVAADASEPASRRFLAAYAGCTVAEWFAHRGRHALVVYDDLTRHAEAYRDLSLTLRRPPGREAYPGDIFSVHARLMERAFKLSDERGGGSVTALPIIETQRGDIAGFIATNLISMTDGQLYLDAGLFSQGQLPAIDIGKSVSRVGRGAQPAIMREVAANLRLEVAQYEEVKAFARFGAILDETTTRQIARGQRVVRILMQAERRVAPLLVEVAELWALKSGHLDDVEPHAVPAFDRHLRALAASFEHLSPAAREATTVTGELERELERWVRQAKAGERPGA
jgi:F-type H+-transporting ATPase subunit alpha